ncbi:hypothetical protein D3C76_1290080 [compost metagenome]
MPREGLFAILLSAKFIVSLRAQHYLFVGQVLGRGFPEPSELVIFERGNQVALAGLFQLTQVVVGVLHFNAITFGVAQ